MPIPTLVLIESYSPMAILVLGAAFNDKQNKFIFVAQFSILLF